MTPPTPPIALTIAGSDSGGGAGIQADLKTFHAFGVFGTSAITAITAQNTLGVTDVHPVPVATVEAQIEAVASDLPPRAVKSGMLATGDLVRAVGKAIARLELPNYVLDPVMVATSGDRLLAEEAEAAVGETLLPLATLVTPNLHEAEILTGMTIRSVAAMREAAGQLVAMGAGAALVKGGHPVEEASAEVVDVLCLDGRSRVWRRPRIRSRDTHGTGCTLSAAVAAGLAHGLELEVAIDDALDYVARAIAEAPGLGAGSGPVNHFVRARAEP